MAWPPTIPPANITDTTPQLTRHPQDHNQISQALTDIVNRLPRSGRWSGMLDANGSVMAIVVGNEAFSAAAPAVVASASDGTASAFMAAPSRPALVDGTWYTTITVRFPNGDNPAAIYMEVAWASFPQ